MTFDDLTIDLSGPSDSGPRPASVTSAPTIDLLGGLGGGADLGADNPDQARIRELLDARDAEHQIASANSRQRREFLVPSEENDGDYIFYIDNSSLENFNTCNRKGYYYSVLGREGTGSSSPLTFGGALHAGLEVRYGAGLRSVTPSTKVCVPGGDTYLLSDVQDAYVDRHYRRSGFIPSVDDHRTSSRAKNVLAAYNEHYPVEPFDFILSPSGQPLCELPFAVPMGVLNVNATPQTPGWTRGPIRRIHIVWTGRIDLATIWDGIPKLMDHKSASMLGESFTKQFWLAPQMIGYCWSANRIPELLALTSGKRFEHLCVNALCIRKITRTGTPTEFVRNHYHYPEALQDEWKHDTLTLVTEFLYNFINGYFPKKANWCIGKYGACPYLDVDSLPIDQRMLMLNSDAYRDVTWNPLDER